MLKNFVKKNFMVTVAWLLAVVTMFFVPPDKEYLGYFDMKTLICLLTIMLCVTAYKNSDIFSVLAVKLIKKLKNTRALTMALVFITYVASIIIANDIALLTFLPLAIAVFKGCGKEKYVAACVILQTIGANLGGMIMPFGNPQSLYIFSFYGLTVSEFVSVMFIPFLVSLVMITVVCLFIPKEDAEVISESTTKVDYKRVAVYTVLFAVSLLSVFDIVNKYIVLAVVIIGIFACDIKVFKGVDYGLLLTFTAFFIFANNMARIEPVYNVVSRLTEANTLLAAVLGCQVMSNVPTGIFLSQFTADWKSLLVGVNIAGVGTPISSLASLITLKAYTQNFPSQTGSYMKKFLIFNFSFLIVLTLICFFIYC